MNNNCKGRNYPLHLVCHAIYQQNQWYFSVQITSVWRWVQGHFSADTQWFSGSWLKVSAGLCLNQESMRIKSVWQRLSFCWVCIRARSWSAAVDSFTVAGEPQTMLAFLCSTAGAEIDVVSGRLWSNQCVIRTNVTWKACGERNA